MGTDRARSGFGPWTGVGRSSAYLLLFVLALQCVCGSPGQGIEKASGPLKRFEYKYSFKPPYLAQKDGTVPFFEYFGHAIASEEMVRITPSLRSQKGMIWARNKLDFQWWQAELHFRVTGRGRIGADGLAFWYTQTKGFEGPVFGSSDRWNGLGVFFDSFDNDNKHNNPYVMAMTNDGTLTYDHQKDGSTQQLGGCLRDFRNKPFPVKAKIEYYQNVLTIMYHNGMSNNEQDYELCMRVENVILPQNGFFGVSAATGGLADDHDVLKLLVSSLKSPDSVPSSGFQEQDSEQKRIELEFEEYQKKLKEQKEQWAKENPDQVKPNEDEWDNWFSESDKELQQIFQGQSAMKEVLTELHRKMDDIISRQERALNLLSSVQGGGTVPSGSQHIPQQTDTIRRDEVSAILANQREIVSASRDIKNFVSDIHGKTGQLLNRGTGSAQPVGGGGYDVHVSIKEMKDSLQHARQEISSATQRMTASQQQGCPSQNCVSTTLFVICLGLHLVVVIVYMIYRDSKESQAKKFY